MLGWRPRVLADMANCSTACSLGVEPLAEILGAEPAEDSFLMSAQPGGHHDASGFAQCPT